MRTLDLHEGRSLTTMDAVVLFFVLGAVAGLLKAELRLPPAVYELVSAILLLSIGLKGGVELSEHLDAALAWQCLAVLGFGVLLTLLTFGIVRGLGRLPRPDAASMAAHYGSVSVATFAVGTAYLAARGLAFDGRMPLFLALLEIPDEYKEGNGKWGGYEWRDGRAVPYRCLSVFGLFARTLGLAQPGAKVAVVDLKETTMPVSTAAVALKTAAGANVILLVNHGSPQASRVSIRVKAPAQGGMGAQLQAWQTAADGVVSSGMPLLQANPVLPRGGYVTLQVDVPAYTAVGMRLQWKTLPGAPSFDPIP
jgi:hypothetical protein